MPDISVVIVNWNVRELLLQCLHSLLSERSLACEIFVVDNASSDGSAEAVREQFPSVTLIVNKQNCGFARANNQAIRQARGRHILLLNPDTIVAPDTLNKTVAYLDAHPNVGILGCKLLNPDGSVQRSIRRNPTALSQALILLKLHALFPKWAPIRSYFALDHNYNEESDVEQVMGAFLAFRRELVESIGMLDEGFFLWFEEVDFCRRAQKGDWRLRYVPSISITHMGGQSFRQLLNVEQQLIFNRSILRYARKHFVIVGTLILTLLTPLSVLFSLGEPLIRRWYAPKTLQ